MHCNSEFGTFFNVDSNFGTYDWSNRWSLLLDDQFQSIEYDFESFKHRICKMNSQTIGGTQVNSECNDSILNGSFTSFQLLSQISLNFIFGVEGDIFLFIRCLKSNIRNNCIIPRKIESRSKLTIAISHTRNIALYYRNNSFE